MKAMDYKKFVSAIKNGSEKEIDQLYVKIFEILTAYLRTVMRANKPDAEDCAQHAFLNTVEQIQNNAIREPGCVYLYMLRSAKNRYLRLSYENKRSNYQDDMESFARVEEDVDLLVTKEEEKALEDCMKKLSRESLEYIQYWLDHPNTPADEVARYFGISINNVWIRKHRIVKKLSECIKKKMNI